MKNKAIIESVAKTLFSLIPYGGGQFLSESFFDYRSRVKQDRLNTFIEMIIEYFEKNNINPIPIEIQQSEDFGDLFESIIKRVLQTRSEDKLVRFRNVLIDYISNPVKVDYTDTYLDIIDRINETQIQILKAHSKIEHNVRNLLKQRDGLSEEISKFNDKLINESELLKKGEPNDYFDITRMMLPMNKKLIEITKEIEVDRVIRKADYYSVNEGDYLFLIQDLYSKGLLVDEGIGMFDTKPFEKMAITNFGKSFLKFIKEYQS